jgi:integrase
MRLTQENVTKLAMPEGKADHIFWDDDLGGFGIRLRAGGRASFLYQYDLAGRSRKMTLGRVTALSVARARKIAVELHAKVRLGQDPAAQRAQGRMLAAETLGAILDRYLDFKRGSLRHASLVDIERYLLRYAKSLHGVPISAIDRRTVAHWLSKIATKNGKVACNRARAALSGFFSWALREGLCDTNPVGGTNQQIERPRGHVLSDDELRAVWSAARDLRDYGVILKLLMLTGQRAGEIGGLKWSEIVGDQIVLPEARTKSKRAHFVPLTAAAKALLDGRPREHEYVFAQRKDAPFSNWHIKKLALDARIAASGIKIKPFVVHDLRRSCATRLGEAGVQPHVIEAVLNHAGHRSGVSGIYNKSTYAREMRVTLEKYEHHLLGVVEGQPGTSRVMKFPA